MSHNQAVEDRIICLAVRLEDKDQDDQAHLLIDWAYYAGLISGDAIQWWIFGGN